MMNKRLGVMAFAAAFVAALVVMIILASSEEKKPAADFVLLDQTSTSLDALRGRVLLVNFWATSCSACIAEMPDLVATHQKFATQGLDTVAVAMAHDRIDFVQSFAAEHRLPFKVAYDATGSAAAAFGDVQLTPTTFLLDKNGAIVKHYLGPPDFAQLHQEIEKLL